MFDDPIATIVFAGLLCAGIAAEVIDRIRIRRAIRDLTRGD